jgi:hypothetical protein
MATLISDTHYILVVGETVISEHKTEAAAERRGILRRFNGAAIV